MKTHSRSIWIVLTTLILTMSILTLSPAFADAPVAEKVSDDRADALHSAARDGDLDKVRKLLAAGVPIDVGNHYEVTALMYASGWGRADVTRFLLEKGADRTHTDNLYGMNAMGWAVSRNHLDVVAQLIEHGADPEKALMSSLGQESSAMAEMLIKTGKISQGLLDAALSKATLDAAKEPTEPKTTGSKIVEALSAAGGKLPPPSTYKVAPALLASYAGVYSHERSAELKIELQVSEGHLTGDFPNGVFSFLSPGNPVPFEALSDTEFRQERSTFFTLTMEPEDEADPVLLITQFGSERPFRFLRDKTPDQLAKEGSVKGANPEESTEKDTEKGTEKSTEATAVAEATKLSEAKMDEPLPKGAAVRDWPGFRGPDGAGTAQGTPPLNWNVEDGTNILWKAPIPGRSHASPIISGDHVFIATAVYGAEEQPFRTGLYGDPDFVETTAPFSWRLLALERSTGKVLWERVAHEGNPRAMHHIKATQMNATPVTDGRRVVAVMGSEGLFCYDFDGKLLWHRDLGTLSVGWFYDEGFEWGHSSSPILHGDHVILQVDRAKDPFIAAYSLADGSEVWRTERDNIPSWGTPALLESSKGTEIVTNGSRMIRGYDAASGRELWSLGPHSEVTVGSVVTGHGLAFAVGNWSPVRAIYAIRPGGRGDLSLGPDVESSKHVPWHYKRGGTYVPSPLVYGKRFYTLANSGILTSYEAKSGERLQRARVAGRGGVAFSASPIAAAGRIYAASEDGDVYIVRHDGEHELLAKNDMGEILMATPAVSGDVLFIRTLDNLYAIGEPTAKSPETLKGRPGATMR